MAPTESRSHELLLKSLVPIAMLACSVAILAPAAYSQSSPPAAAAAPPQSSSAQAPASATQPPAADKPEMDTHDSIIPLQSRVNLVPIRVVVRDPKGQILTSLRKEDFQVFEDGKPQDISFFSIETPASFQKSFVKPDFPPGTPDSEKPPADFAPASRFIALLFDDAHVTLQDLMRSRMAAERYIDTALQPTDRVAVFTISGQSEIDFTSDREKLHSALRGLLPRRITGSDTTGKTECPPMDYYEADLIQNKNDQNALTVATLDAIECQFNGDKTQTQAAQQLALATALRIDDAGQTETKYSFRRLDEVLRRIAGTPGQRSLILVSPGFIYSNQEYLLSEIIDRANRANVFINTLDARGLYTPDIDDIGGPYEGDPTVAGPRALLRTTAMVAQSDVLLTLADGTGGMAFHNNNDLKGGLQAIASMPEVSYLIAFVPNNLKYDGRFHSLKVTLTSKQRVSIQARRGFYAPKRAISADDIAKQDIEDAVFSQETQHGLPVELHTQYYKVDSVNAKLAVMTHVDVAHVRFEKQADRNRDDLVIVAALFDRDGNIITAIQKSVEMRLRDATLARLARTGITVKTNFDVKPGDYVVRLVVRDANDARLSTENGVVQIPY
ncbi:MAG TPA: VWA domain-containing protein [Candidatus Limnocylindrales bacterium]|nr:VWA domain-containing protein [Candidatus Limnocylindrales bacterium]